MAVNKFILSGRWTKDPEVRYGGANNRAIARASLAVKRNYKKEGQPEADFIPVVMFGKTAEIAEKYCRKGSEAVIVGSIQNDNYTNKDGKSVYSFSFVANELHLVGGRGGDGSLPAGSAPEGAADGFMDIDEDDEIPFA